MSTFHWTNLLKESNIFSIGHGREPARRRLKSRSSPLLMWRRSNQRSQCSFNQISFNGPDSNQRVGHGRSPSIQSIRRIRNRVTTVNILVQTTPEWARMVRRGTHTHLLRRITLFPYDLLARRNSDRPTRRYRSINRESYGRRRWRRSVEVHSIWRGRTVEETTGSRRKARRRRSKSRGIGWLGRPSIEPARRRYRPAKPARYLYNRLASFCSCWCRHFCCSRERN